MNAMKMRRKNAVNSVLKCQWVRSLTQQPLNHSAGNHCFFIREGNCWYIYISKWTNHDCQMMTLNDTPHCRSAKDKERLENMWQRLVWVHLSSPVLAQHKDTKWLHCFGTQPSLINSIVPNFYPMESSYYHAMSLSIVVLSYVVECHCNKWMLNIPIFAN